MRKLKSPPRSEPRLVVWLPEPADRALKDELRADWHRCGCESLSAHCRHLLREALERTRGTHYGAIALRNHLPGDDQG